MKIKFRMLRSIACDKVMHGAVTFEVKRLGSKPHNHSGQQIQQGNYINNALVLQKIFHRLKIQILLIVS